MISIPKNSFFVFDLDGTLFNTLDDLAISVNFALTSHGLEPHDTDRIKSFIGNGSLNLIQRSLGPEKEHLAASLHHTFLTHYDQHCLEQVKPYPGVTDFFENYEGPCALLTNKPIGPTLKILDHFKMRDRFLDVLGGDNSPARKPHPAGLLALMAKAHRQPHQTFMVGDDLPDIQVAKNAQVPSVIINSGFGNPTLLAQAQPDYQVENFSAFVNLLAS